MNSYQFNHLEKEFKMQIFKSKLLSTYKALILICLFGCLGFSTNTEAKTDLAEIVKSDSFHTLFFISIEGDQQDLITKGASSMDSIGNLFLETHQDEIIGLGLSHGILIPTDAAGQPTGSKVHGQLSISKYFDKCGPLLYQALITGENLIVEIKFYRTTMDGTNEHYFTIKLDDAMIVNIRSQSAIGQHAEEVSFVYETITWTHEVVNTNSTDTWNSIP